MSFTQNFRKFLLLIFFSLVVLNFANSESPLKDWEEHSENIIILDTDEVNSIVKKNSAILLDFWKKDIKPEKLDPKKWLPAQRYSIPGAKWIPNAGLETLTPELRNYFDETVKRLTKSNKDAKIVCFCFSSKSDFASRYRRDKSILKSGKISFTFLCCLFI